MKKPCKNCPFRAEGAITLQEGRVAGIVEDLKDDFKVFHCRKTVHSSKGGDWIDLVAIIALAVVLYTALGKL